MLDNMDGITGTVSFFVLSLCFIGLFFLNGFSLDYNFILITSVIGALLGFMYFNINPSRMFMGDTGSQFISFFVAYFSIEGLWNFPSISEMPSWTGAILVLTIFTPAAVDTLAVVVNRLKKRQSPMVGGKDHTTHYLVYKGVSDFGVWVVFLALSVIALLLGVVILLLIQEQFIWFTLIGVFYFIFVFILLYRNTLKYKNPNE
jgi:UDP-GlcNAc:undecaprenyl-phosphate GlcNAc-1-phosphate transferase